MRCFFWSWLGPKRTFTARGTRLPSSKLFFLLIALVGAVLPALAASPSRTLFVRCGKLIYDAEKPPMTNAQVVIVDGQVKEVGTSLGAPAGAQQLDLSSYTVIPGLIDAHTHLWTGPFLAHPSDPLAALRATKAVCYALESGVAAMRILATAGFIDVALRDAIDEGIVSGPHIVPAGHAISTPGGHGDFLDFPFNFPLTEYYSTLNGLITSPAEAEKAVLLQIKYGAGVIKIAASGGVVSPIDSPTAEQLSPEEMRVIVEEAHMHGLKVAAHAENLKSILDALRAGVDSIEHGSEMNDDALQYMKARGVYLVPTLYVVDNFLENGEKEHAPAYMLRKARALAKTHFPSFKLSLASGVLIAAGSDMLYEPGKGTVLNELMTEVKYGMTPQQALLSGTKRDATLLGLDHLGTISEGMEGDLVAVEGDPLQDIHALEHVKAVVHQGRVVVDRTR